MPQMSPIIWEMFILISVFSLILSLTYFNYLMFTGVYMKQGTLKNLKMSYKW